MRRGKAWVLILIVGILTLTTVCYVTMVKNAKTTYANGKFVEREDECSYEIRCCLPETGAGLSGC